LDSSFEERGEKKGKTFMLGQLRTNNRQQKTKITPRQKSTTTRIKRRNRNYSRAHSYQWMERTNDPVRLAAAHDM
jgi:hypothetical protein